MTRRRHEGSIAMLRHAAEWRLLGLLFERPRQGWHEEVAALAGEVEDSALRQAARHRLAEATEGEYLAALGPGGIASPREAGHAGLRDPGWILAELARFYEAFGYRPRREDPVDHAAVEAGFVAYLWLKEAYARERGDEDAAATTRAARERFLSEHLAELAQPMAAKLSTAEANLAEVANLLAARVPPPRRLGPASAHEDPIPQCGACPASSD